MARLLVKNIRTLVSCDEADRIYQGVDLLCEGGIIRSITPASEGSAAAGCATAVSGVAPDEVIDGSHMLCYPGLVNAHHHLCQVFSRNLPEVQNLELFAWLRALYEIWKKLDERAVYLATLVAAGELAKNGCTTVFDHNYVFPAHAGDLMAAQARAGDELGLRLHLSRGSMDLSVKDGGLPPDSVVQTVDEIMASSIDCIERFHDPSFGSMRRVALAPCSPFSVSGELLRQSAVVAREQGVRLHTHLAETKDEENYTLERFGLRPLAYMESLGWLGPDVWFAHGIHFSSDELRLLAQTHTGVCHCPISNMKLSSGVARVSEMLALGVPVGLGVDGSASNDGSNLLEELRVAYLLHRLECSAEAPSGYDLLRMATMGGARLLGREREIGSLEPGKCADFFCVDSRRLELVGACYDPGAVLATVGLKAPVDLTVVAGCPIVRDGRLTAIDEQAVSAQARQKVASYLGR